MQIRDLVLRQPYKYHSQELCYQQSVLSMCMIISESMEYKTGIDQRLEVDLSFQPHALSGFWKLGLNFESLQIFLKFQAVNYFV